MIVLLLEDFKGLEPIFCAAAGALRPQDVDPGEKAGWAFGQPGGFATMRSKVSTVTAGQVVKVRMASTL